MVRLAARLAVRLALAAAAAALVLAYVLFRHGIPEETASAVARGAVAVLLFVPPVVLGLFALALRELAEVPERLRTFPRTASAHAAELAELLGPQERRGSRVRDVGSRLWRLAHLSRSSRELLTPYAPVLALASVPFLASVAIAAVIAVAEVGAALIALLALAL